MEITNHSCALAAILGQIECQQRDENYWMNVCGCARPQIDSCHLREEKQINFASLKLGDRRLKCPGRFFCLACAYEPDLPGKLMVASKGSGVNLKVAKRWSEILPLLQSIHTVFINQARMALPTRSYYLVFLIPCEIRKRW
jgi:hypothetical protein